MPLGGLESGRVLGFVSDRGFEAGCLFDLMPLGGLESGRVLGFVSDRGFEAGCPFLALGSLGP